MMDSHSPQFKVRLGLFLLGGLTLFMVAIFIIGKQKNLFNPVFTVTAKFYNIGGLQVGNNIRFSGINVGTVDNIKIIDDTTVQVDMLIKEEVKKFIKSDCIASIGSEGIIGDRVLVISQGSKDAPRVKEGQELGSDEPVETDAILASLKVSAQNAEVVTDQLADIMYKINSGTGTLGRLIQDTAIAENLSQTITNLKKGTKGLNENMEAAKHNFLLKGYFNKKDREAKQKKEDGAKQKKDVQDKAADQNKTDEKKADDQKKQSEPKK